MIVIGVQGTTLAQELMTGITLKSVVRLAKQPVLIVRSLKQVMQTN